MRRFDRGQAECPASSRQRGVALITALLVVSLVTVIAVAMATRQHIDVRLTGNLVHGEQAYAYALAAESWARVILRRDDIQSDHDSLDEDWATALPPIAVEGGQVSGKIEDLQGRFNINNLVMPDGKVSEADVAYFRRLLEIRNWNRTSPMRCWTGSTRISMSGSRMVQKTRITCPAAFRTGRPIAPWSVPANCAWLQDSIRMPCGCWSPMSPRCRRERL
jgi:hypothetical protein